MVAVNGKCEFFWYILVQRVLVALEFTLSINTLVLYVILLKCIIYYTGMSNCIALIKV